MDSDAAVSAAGGELDGPSHRAAYDRRGLAFGGGAGIAFGIAFGAAAGVIVGSAYDALGHR